MGEPRVSYTAMPPRVVKFKNIMSMKTRFLCLAFLSVTVREVLITPLLHLVNSVSICEICVVVSKGFNVVMSNSMSLPLLSASVSSATALLSATNVITCGLLETTIPLLASGIVSDATSCSYICLMSSKG